MLWIEGKRRLEIGEGRVVGRRSGMDAEGVCVLEGDGRVMVRL